MLVISLVRPSEVRQVALVMILEHFRLMFLERAEKLGCVAQDKSYRVMRYILADYVVGCV